MSSYLPLFKQLHMLFALASLAGFLLRGILLLLESSLLYRRWMRTWPHIIDTLLLVFGLLLLFYGPWSLNHFWLQLKLGLLVLYILLGLIALRPGRVGKVTRVNAWWLGMVVFIYMMALAKFKHPLLMFG
jgi:uncharacterized membrane protein SirB2